MKTTYIIVNRGKFIRSITLLSVLFIGILLMATMIGNYVSGKGLDVYAEYEVQSGDRLWEIAGKVDSDEDVRKIVHTIKRVNNISSEEYIYPGQVLKIPYTF
jgi:nucleoid-associated protein YgaU